MRIVIENAEARFSEFRFSGPVNWEMAEGENWAVVGPNGAGKSIFADLLLGKVALRSGSVRCYTSGGMEVKGAVRCMAFRDIHSLTDNSNMYYQQRWNSQDAEESPEAISLLSAFPEEKIAEYTRLFDIDGLLYKRIISLSSGELRKFLITRMLMTEPAVLILDNPFIGLDAASRILLDNMLRELNVKKGLQVVLVLSQLKDLPLWIDKVLPIKDMVCFSPFLRNDFVTDGNIRNLLFPESDGLPEVLPRLPEKNETLPPVADEILYMENVRVTYAGVPILEGLDWKVMKGEKWALLGENGSGKSTLLSLVCGDNPQAYANRMRIFGRWRGSGESIWDIKRRIGYLSADMHTYYMEDIPCLKVVASGYYDSVGLFRKCSEEQYGSALMWMKIFHAEHLAERSFLRISYGEQRLVLLVRAFVKNPDLLILDEPLHGLDSGKKELARKIIGKFCADPEKTLIYVSHYRDEIPESVQKEKMLIRKKITAASE